MCGICGIAIPERLNRSIDESMLIQMRDSLTHRGPDDAGLHIDGGVGLAHRRLSIVDLAGGHQPMPNEDRTIWITYNGEVYNHNELRPALEAKGHVYQNSSDTETIIHLYEEHGARAVESLRGMFAFAIWDRNRRKLVLGRDRLGVKPLYYTISDDGVLYFASEIKALIETQAVRTELNYDALADYAANRATSGDETLFRGVRRLAPGCLLIWNDGAVRIERYWDLSFAKSDKALSDGEYIDQFEDLFEESVRLRLMSDVPLGMFLSGGIDSSAILSVMSEMVAEPVKTFSVAFEEREANELYYARKVANAFGTDHHEVVVSPQQFFDSLPGLVYQEDEPIAHPSSVPLFFVSELARQYVKVVLTGEGSDELLAGYDKYRKTVFNLAVGKMYYSAVPGPVRRTIGHSLEALDRSSRIGQKLSRTFLCLEPSIEEIYFDNFSVFSRAMQQRLFTEETREQMREQNPYRSSVDLMERVNSRNLLDQLLGADMKTYLHELLMKQDQMSMAASIESRVPFLDHKLVEFAAGLPVNLKLRNLTTKYILRRTMRGRLPREILTRRKMGFPVPIGKWLRGGFSHVVDEYVLSDRTMERRIFNSSFVRELVARHNSGENHTERLWTLINFEIWQRRFFDREPITFGNRTASPLWSNVGAIFRTL